MQENEGMVKMGDFLMQQLARQNENNIIYEPPILQQTSSDEDADSIDKDISIPSIPSLPSIPSMSSVPSSTPSTAIPTSVIDDSVNDEDILLNHISIGKRPVIIRERENTLQFEVGLGQNETPVTTERPKIRSSINSIPVLPNVSSEKDFVGSQQGVIQEAHRNTLTERERNLQEEMSLALLQERVPRFAQIDEFVRGVLTQEFGKTENLEEHDESFKKRVSDFIYASAKRKAEAEQSLMHEGMLRYYSKYVYDDVFQLSVLQDLLDDESVTEIMVVTFEKIFIERSGKIVLSPLRFRSREHLKETIDRIINPLGRSLSDLEPNVDGRLPDRSRISATMHGIAVDGPTLTVRKFPKTPWSGNTLLEKESVSEEMLEFLQAIVKAKLNVFISGGTGSGKTVTLNILSNYIDSADRVLTIEDSIELNLACPHWEPYEARPGNLDGKGTITIRNILKWALRKRPDCIVIGECRGEEALDMLQALNTGHYGYSTGHANNPKELIKRLSTMVWQAGISWTGDAILQQITSAIQFIVQVKRLPDGTRKITQITEILGMGEDGAKRMGVKHDPNLGDSYVYMQDIFYFQETGVTAEGKIIGEFKRGAKPFHFSYLQRRTGLRDMWLGE